MAKGEAEELLFVGGEFYDDNCWKTDRVYCPADGAVFLNGGKACLTVISNYLRDHKITRVLLPTYLCPTISDAFEAGGLGCDYYRIRSDFSIDLPDLVRRLESHQAVYFIHYFGFPPAAEVMDRLKNLKKAGRILIEDFAQAGTFDSIAGDFAFNSMRKFCPCDGGYLKTNLDVQPYIEKYAGQENRRLPFIRQYRQDLRKYLLDGMGEFDDLQALFAKAEFLYKTEPVVWGDEEERKKIESLDWPAIKEKRRQNYIHLLQLIKENGLITPVFMELPPDIMPLGLPVYVKDNLRDALNDYLGENSIGLTIHWEDLLNDPRISNHTDVLDMAKNILTLTVDQYTNQKQLEYLAKKLADF